MEAGLFAFRERAGIFGCNAPDFGSIPARTPPLRNWDPVASGTFSWSVWRVWRGDTSTVFRSNLAIFGCDLALERVVPQLTRGGWMLIEHARGYYRPFWVNGVSERTFTGFTLSTRGTGLRLRFAGDTDNYLLSPSPSELAADPTYWG